MPNFQVHEPGCPCQPLNLERPTNMWGTAKDEVGEGYCPDCERNLPWHYEGCATTRRWSADAEVTVKVDGLTSTQPIPGLVTEAGADETARYYAVQVARDVAARRGSTFATIDIHPR